MEIKENGMHGKISHSQVVVFSVSKRVRNHSYENVFRLQVHFHVKQTQFHMKGFAQGLVLKEGNLETTK